MAGDGEAYPSACHANINSVDVMNLGGCEDEEPSDCRDDGCGDGDECQYCWGSWQCIPEGAVC